MDEHYAVGLDIGSSKIYSCIGKLNRLSNLQIIGVATSESEGLKNSVVVDIENVALSIKNCTNQLQRIAGIEINEVYVSLASNICELVWNRGIIAISSEDKEIKQSDVHRVLDSVKVISVPSDKEIIGVIPQQYTIDGYSNIKDPVGMSGLKLEVDAYVVIIKSTILNNLIKSINKAGFKIKGFILQPIAISKAVLSKQEMEIGTAVIDIGAESSNISIFKSSNLLSTSTIQLGGNKITNDISICLKIPYSEAERIKLKYADIQNLEVNSNEQIKVKTATGNFIMINKVLVNQIIEARVGEILNMIKDKIATNQYLKDINSFVIVGGGIAYIKGIENYTKTVLEKQVKLGVPDFDGCNSPIYATCSGIVKDALENLKDNIYNDFEKNDEYYYDEENSDEENNGLIKKIKKIIMDFFN